MIYLWDLLVRGRIAVVCHTFCYHRRSIYRKMWSGLRRFCQFRQNYSTYCVKRVLPRDRRGRCNIAYAHVDETHAVPPSARSDGMASHVFEKVQARRRWG